MQPWLHLFSLFSTEALIVEAFFILSLISFYIGYWILIKRKFGVIQKEMLLPPDPVKDYLTVLIDQAGDIRSTLFGLTPGAAKPVVATVVAAVPALPPVEAAALPPADAAAASTAPPADASQLTTLQAQLQEKTQTAEKLAVEKTQLEQKLAELSTQATSADKPKGENPEVVELKGQLATLQAKLDEYNIIEDDLADLKRFQVENTQLRALLQEKGIPIPDTIVSPVKGAKTPAGASGAAPESPPSEGQGPIPAA